MEETSIILPTQVPVTGSSHGWGMGPDPSSASRVSTSIVTESVRLVVAIGSHGGSCGGSRFWSVFGGNVYIEPSVNACVPQQVAGLLGLLKIISYLFLFRPSMIKFYRNIGRLKR